MVPPANFKRSCSSFESSNPGSPIHNRVHRRVITRDPGKPIYQASSLVAIISGFIGAIKGEDLIMSIESIADFLLGHESLLNAGILHRDVSCSEKMKMTVSSSVSTLPSRQAMIERPAHRARLVQRSLWRLVHLKASIIILCTIWSPFSGFYTESASTGMGRVRSEGKSKSSRSGIRNQPRNSQMSKLEFCLRKTGLTKK